MTHATTMLAIVALTGAGTARAQAGEPAPTENVTAPAAPVPPPAHPEPSLDSTAYRLSAYGSILEGGAVQLEVSKRFGGALGLDVAFGANDMGYDHAGVAADVLGRLYMFSGIGGLSLAVGPSLRTGSEFGGVGWLRSELALELRPRGFDILVGAGPSLALNDSGHANCPDMGWFGCLLWNEQIHTGDVEWRIRLALGVTF
jgi:hypothetical protein